MASSCRRVRRADAARLLLSFPNGVTNNYAYYVVSKGVYILLGTDPLSAQDPLTLGTILLQAGVALAIFARGR